MPAQQKIQVFRGMIENVKEVTTRSRRKMVTFATSGYPFKAFDDKADAVRQLAGEHAEIRAKHNTYKGKDEFAVFMVVGEVGGRRIAASDTSRSAVTSPHNVPIVKNRVGPSGRPRTISTAPVATSQRIASAEKAAARKVPEIQGLISKIKSVPTRDGRKMIIFDIGPHHCMLFDEAAEFVERHAPEYEGKLISVYGHWKPNERGRNEFVPEGSKSAIRPDAAGTLTADEVQKALEGAFFAGSSLRSAGGPTFEEMEAEYKVREERKRLGQIAEASGAAV